MLGEIAREFDVYLVAQAKAKDPDFEGVFFNIGFILDPTGEVILKHYKSSPLFPVEHSVCPHDVWDRWVELYGRNLQSFFPVVDTPIGRLGGDDGQRGLVSRERPRAGDERRRGHLPRLLSAPRDRQRVLRDPEPRPRARQQPVRRRARTSGPTTSPRRATADRHLRRPVLHLRLQGPDRRPAASTARVELRRAASIDIEALRHHRARAQWDNWMKDLRTELYQMRLREADLPQEPLPQPRAHDHAEYRARSSPQVRLMHERGIWARPGRVAGGGDAEG